MTDYLESDLEFAAFLASVQVRVSPGRLGRNEGWVDSPWHARQKEYDQKTERLRVVMRQANSNERKAS